MAEPDTPLLTLLRERIANSPLKGEYTLKSGVKGTVPCLTFRDYMEACLYEPEYGYYRSGPLRVGKDGDFYTSSAVGDVMGEVLARYTLANANAARTNGPSSIVEWGAGTGKLSAATASAGMKLTPAWEKLYSILLIEDHPAHAAAIEQSFRQGGLDNMPVVMPSSAVWAGKAADWFSKGPSLLIANELLDAFPVHRIARRGGKLVELGVAISPSDELVDVEMTLRDGHIESWLERDGIRLLEGQTTEVCADARDWLLRVGGLLISGSQMMLIDYGHEAEEYAANHRMNGTLMAYWNHRAGDEPLLFPGQRDITAHVSFTFIRASAEEAGFRVVYFNTQKQFLADFGAFELLQNHDGQDPFSAAAKRNRAVRQLLLSDGMSESFKVMILEKD
ncbi:class I SAM-dependent methyltransferase [Paenibacillus sp. GCM10027627]|uniref:class I SAM-dependent methyltransferase n=1 Tax=unclassified Paenibacillus TaxID=185978 RepID=UPI00364549E2